MKLIFSPSYPQFPTKEYPSFSADLFLDTVIFLPVQVEFITLCYFAGYRELTEWKLCSQEILNYYHISLQQIQIIYYKRCSQFQDVQLSSAISKNKK